MIHDFLLGCAALETKFGVKHGGHRFWLFVANWLATLSLFVLFGWHFALHFESFWIVFVIAVFAVGVFVWLDIVKIWNGLIANG